MAHIHKVKEVKKRTKRLSKSPYTVNKKEQKELIPGASYKPGDQYIAN